MHPTCSHIAHDGLCRWGGGQRGGGEQMNHVSRCLADWYEGGYSTNGPMGLVHKGNIPQIDQWDETARGLIRA
eukprot:4729488-Pyramimonas_sp.AAC.1